MRRKDREITDPAQIEAIIRQTRVCRLGLIDGDTPYVVPLSFGYGNRTVYFHTAKQGKKLELIRKNPRVCVEFDQIEGIARDPKICKWGFYYASVIGFGRAEILTDAESVKSALDLIVKQYGGDDFNYSETALTHAVAVKVTIEHMTGKKAPMPE